MLNDARAVGSAAEYPADGRDVRIATEYERSSAGPARTSRRKGQSGAAARAQRAIASAGRRTRGAPAPAGTEIRGAATSAPDRDAHLQDRDASARIFGDVADAARRSVPRCGIAGADRSRGAG